MDSLQYIGTYSGNKNYWDISILYMLLICFIKLSYLIIVTDKFKENYYQNIELGNLGRNKIIPLFLFKN